MTDRLKISIEKLYDTFAKYQGLSKMEGSPHYDDLNTWNKELRSKKLKELTDEDLSRFAGKVILTWGDENDYRCYLPRILELTAELKTPYNIWTLYSRLEYANWKTWDIEEQTAINDFTLELWNNLLNDNSEKAEWEFKEYFQAFANFYPDFSKLLTVWETNDSFASIKHLTNYIFEERQHLFDNNYIDGIEKNTKNIDQFKTWLTSDKIIKKIEKAFYDNQKDEIAERLSWVEQILTNEKKYSP
jgi:predicted ATPase